MGVKRLAAATAILLIQAATAFGSAPDWLAIDTTMTPFAVEAGTGQSASRTIADLAVHRDAERAHGGRSQLAAGAALARLAGPSVAFKPVVPRPLSFDVERLLRPAFQEAQRRVREIPQCRDLFTVLDANALVSLRRAFYVPASRIEETRYCGRGALAFTQAGSPLIRLCRRFSRLNTERAALAVIHESLHVAGLGEWPSDPGAMTSAEIDALVAERCARGIPGTRR